ncbi:MAG: hypothetical protein KAV00_01855 [Phycisphaerae bacterium]|nr:hypothetical protein [Phycisphaerae bacterium]
MGSPPLTQQPILHVDGTPNAGYPLRILEAYRARCDCKWEVEGLDDDIKLVYGMMNEHQDQRAAILDDAIATLETLRG